MFQSRCLYKHNDSKEISVRKEIDKCNELVLDLKAEIAQINDENDRKVNILVKVHLKELNDLRKENNVLKQQLEELKESEENTEIGRAKVSHTTNNQETSDLKDAALNVIPNNPLYLQYV